MAMKATTWLRTWSFILVCLAALGAAACGSVEPSPTAPTPVANPAPDPAPAPAPDPAPAPAPAPDPAPAPEPPPPPPPSGPGRLEVAITPNPVPWSGAPVPGCSLPNTWMYEQVLRNTGGTRLTVSDRADSFDGVEVSARSGLGIVLDPGAEHRLTTRWCSANNIEHKSQTRFSGSDEGGTAINVTGPEVTLLPR